MSEPRIAFDSCTILHLLSPTPVWFPFLERIYKDALTGQFRIVVSEVSITECARLEVTGEPALTPEESARRLNDFFRRSFIIRRGITGRESELAVRLVREHDLGACDALVAATAVYADADILYTTDGCGKRRKPGKLIDVKQIVREEDGRVMRVEPPDRATCDKLRADRAPAAPSLTLPPLIQINKPSKAQQEPA
jgi:predicted nucleic acid-binding protein